MDNSKKLLKTLSSLIENGILTSKDIKKEISTDLKFKRDKTNMPVKEQAVLDKNIDEMYESKRFYIHKILLLKSAFSIIDQLFQQEITNAQQWARYAWSSCCYKKPKPPQETNEFIKYILDPFEGGTIHNWDEKKFIERRQELNPERKKLILSEAENFINKNTYGN